jgi:hypothetical protein
LEVIGFPGQCRTAAFLTKATILRNPEINRKNVAPSA